MQLTTALKGHVQSFNFFNRNKTAGGNLSIVGAQINSQGFSARAGGNYEERAAYDIKERVNVESIERSGPGVYLADFNNDVRVQSTKSTDPTIPRALLNPSSPAPAARSSPSRP